MLRGLRLPSAPHPRTLSLLRVAALALSFAAPAVRAASSSPTVATAPMEPASQAAAAPIEKIDVSALPASKWRKRLTPQQFHVRGPAVG